jgi:multidrug efflux system membrane fusion protein
MRIPALLLTAFALTAAHAQDKKDDPKPPVRASDFTGLVEATSAEMRARVTGFVVKMLVQEGDAVKAGQLLVEIDPRPYQAQLDVAKSQVTLAEAQVKLASANFARAKRASDLGTGTKEDLDKSTAEFDVAKAVLLAAKATHQIAELNLQFTKITAPIDGRIGRFFHTEGNLIVQDKDKLMTIVSTDPLRIAFDVDERTVLRLSDALGEGKFKPGNLVVNVGFANEDGFPHMLPVDFIDNKIDPKTGTLRFGAKLANPKGQYIPGSFVRVRLTLAK